jgi:glycosyltransferase involved in cell wall biosynthesis
MNEINIFFDIEVIIEAFFGHKRGIYFVAWNVLQIMQKNKNFNITLTYPYEYANSAKLKKLKKIPFFLQLKFYCAGSGNIEITVQQNIEIHRKNKNYIKMLYNYLRLLNIKIKKNIYYNEKEVIDAHVYISPFYAIPKNILKQHHIKKFYILYDAIPVILPEYSWIFSHKMIIGTLNKNIYPFCISQSCKDDYLKYFGDKLDADKMLVTHIATNQNYVPNYNKQELLRVLKKYGIEHNQNDNYLFSLCSLEPRKNLPFTIACFLRFIKKHNIQDLYFYLGGDIWKNFESALAKTLEYAGELRHKIKLLGYVDDSDINILYSNGLFFTFLSQYEGFGMPPLEAMQAGTPVITSNNSSLPEVVGDAAISLTYNDEEAVIKAFEDFYFNESLRKEYIAKGLERAKMFSWEKCVGKMVGVIEDIVKC